MSIRHKSTVPHPRLGPLAVGTLITVALSIAVSHAFAASPDYEGVQQRMQQAVEEGKMTQAEADKALGAIREKMAKRQADEAKARERIQQAVEAGEMTPEQGRAKSDMLELDQAGGESQAEAVDKDIRDSVSAGQLTEKAAEEEVSELRKYQAD